MPFHQAPTNLGSRDTPANLKLLLSPQQSRGITRFI